MTDKGKKTSILIVEDESIIALDIKARLTRLGYTVPAMADSGEGAIEKAGEFRPDLVLMDINLKRAIDGIEAAQQIRSRFDIPVVYLTAYADESTVQRAQLTAPFGYVLKPVEENELRTNIEMALYRHRMEQKLTASEHWLSITLRSIGDAVIATDAQGRIELMNPVAERLTGWTQHEARSKDSADVFRIFYGETGEPVESPVARVLKEGVTIELEDNVLLLAKDGQKIPIDDSAAPIMDDQGNLDGVVVVFRDVTERKRAEQALRRRNRELGLVYQAGQAFNSTLDLDEVLGTVLEEVRDQLGVAAVSIWLIDAATNELVCRQAVGHQSEGVCGWRLELGEGIVGWVANSGEGLIVPDTMADQRHFKEVDQMTGVMLRSLLSVPLWVKGDVIGVLQVGDAVVNRFGLADTMLLESLAASAGTAIDNARLVETLRQRTSELETRNEELDAFAHTAAHDLKSPLGLIVGYAHTLEYIAQDQNGDLLSDDDLRAYLGKIAQTGTKMCNIVDELLLLSAVRSTEITVSPLDMTRVIADAQARLAHLVSASQAEITLVGDWPTGLGHAGWIEEVWANYISNGIKYGGAPPRVELGATAQADGMVRFWVRDNGPGIAPEAQERLFTPFTRLDQVRASGHGLGLSIVRRIVEKLGGRVGVESEPSGGCVFSFTLPAAPSQIEVEESVPAELALVGLGA